MLSIALLMSALATEGGTISGHVRSDDDLPIPGATVTVRSDVLDGDREVLASTDGAFLLPALPPGEYELVAMRSSYQTVKKVGLVVEEGRVAAISFSLELSEPGCDPLPTPPRSAINWSGDHGAVLERPFLQRLPIR